MKKTINLVIVTSLALGFAGCSSDQPNPAEDKALRNSMAKTKFDINDVPPDKREMVRGFMNQKPPSAGGEKK